MNEWKKNVGQQNDCSGSQFSFSFCFIETAKIEVFAEQTFTSYK